MAEAHFFVISLIMKWPKILLVVILLVASFLRLWKLSVNPVSLFGDELDLGYQAYSILQTGRDYQGNFMPIHFHSMAEWRTPLYLYSAVPTVALFGISPLGVRLPAAIFGILGVFAMYLLVKEISKNESLSQVAAGMLAISPWHLQYSRAGFEVTEMLFFLLLGLWLFFKTINEKNGKWLWLSVVCLVLTPWIYSTAKLFTPFLLVFLFLMWRKEIMSVEKRNLYKAVLAGLIVGLPIAYGALFGGGAARFNYISVFSDPTTIPEVGFSRSEDAKVRGETGMGLSPKLTDRVFHNKFTKWGEVVTRNVFQPFSTEFLFIKGDPDPRHSVGIGEFYKIDAIFLILGIVFFFTKFSDKKIKLLLVFWTLMGVIPAAITRDGGNHATRVILILPPLIFLISYGIIGSIRALPKKQGLLLGAGYAMALLISFIFYMHAYWVHYPYESERWWHYGWVPAVAEIKSIDSNYDKVIISMAVEPAWIFFAGAYEFPPDIWQREFSPENGVEVPGFGKISHVGKFYFGTPQPDVQIYGINRFIDTKTLYLANAKEVGANLMMEPEKMPSGLKLIKTVAFPSGEPAFYLFAGTAK